MKKIIVFVFCYCVGVAFSTMTVGIFIEACKAFGEKDFLGGGLGLVLCLMTICFSVTGFIIPKSIIKELKA